MANLYNQIKTARALTSVARTNGTVNGDTVDKAPQGSPGGNTYNSVNFVILTATLTDGVHTISVQDSDDGSSWADAAAGDQTAAVVTAAANDDTVFEVGYHGRKRFCRLKCVTSGATTGGVLGAVALLGNGRFPYAK